MIKVCMKVAVPSTESQIFVGVTDGAGAGVRCWHVDLFLPSETNFYPLFHDKSSSWVLKHDAFC